MAREPLDSVEYESTYLELRPESERLSDTMAAPILARADGRVDDAIDLYGIDAAETGITSLGHGGASHLSRMLGPPTPQAVHPSDGPPTGLPRLSTSGRSSFVPSRRPSSPSRLRSWTLLVSLAALSTSLGVVAYADVRAAQALFIAITGALILGSARLAWRGTPRAEPFGAGATRVVDRLVTAIGTFFAIALWAKYAPQASAGFSRTVVLVLCGVGLMAGLLTGSRTLHP